ncbi:unnamed protein product [Musa textilis]
MARRWRRGHCLALTAVWSLSPAQLSRLIFFLLYLVFTAFHRIHSDGSVVTRMRPKIECRTLPHCNIIRTGDRERESKKNEHADLAWKDCPTLP